MESLWPKFGEDSVEENNSIPLLRAQARAIKNETNGIVSATFSKIQYKSGPTASIVSLGQMVSSMSSPFYEETLDDELMNKKDINDLYEITKYKFELFNNDYRFRLFVLNYSVFFPISLDVDSGILGDIQYINNSPIFSNNELEDTLRSIFSSNKVRTVISKMLQNK